MDNLPQLQQEKPLRFTAGDIIGSIIIGEAVAWLLFVMVRVNAPELPIPAGLAGTLDSWGTAIALAVALPLLSVMGLAVAFVIAKRIRILYQAAKFALVGAFNTFIDFGIVNAFIMTTDIAEGTPALFFKGVGFTIAVINSYAWNRYWTFSRTGHKVKREFIQFLVVSVIGLVINVAAFDIVVNRVGAPDAVAPQLWANVGILAATAVALFWNFIGYKFWVFKR